MAERETTTQDASDLRARSIAGAFAALLGVAAITALILIEKTTPSTPPAPRPRPKPTMFWAETKQPLSVVMTGPVTDWDLSHIQDATRRKEAFVRTLLPLILAENDRIRDQRKSVQQDEPPPGLYERYRVDPGDRALLLRRVDIVPTSLAMAQAAIESGWGTSRFVQAANNLFGERTYKPNANGVAPKEADGFKVTRFDSIERSIRSYMHNLNSHPAYRDFRLAREDLRQRGVSLTGPKLAQHLLSYSERGKDYVASVQRVIRDNDLQILDKAQLAQN